MKNLYIVIIALVIFTGCKKVSTINPDFDVSINKLTFKTTDTVIFNISGSPNNITFYSGEPGKNYDFKDRTELAGQPQLQFTSYLQKGGELNTLSLLASTDFNGTIDAANFNSATWTDITSLSKLSTGTDNTASGVIDLKPFDKGKPVYFAFRYKGYQSTTLSQPTWTIRTFNVNNILPDGRTYLIASIDKLGWAALDFKNPTTVWSIASTGQVSINGTGTASTSDDNDDVIITRSIDPEQVSEDLGTVIQYTGSAKISSYSYQFSTPGNYTVTFVGFNQTVDERKEIVKKFNLTIN